MWLDSVPQAGQAAVGVVATAVMLISVAVIVLSLILNPGKNVANGCETIENQTLQEDNSSSDETF